VGRLSGALERRSWWLRYGGSCALTVLVIAARWWLNPVWGRQHNRHLVFLPTIMAAAGLAGLGPGLLATVLSTTALALFWRDAGLHPLLNSDLTLFFFVSVAICVLLQSLRVARDRAERARLSREQLLAVVAHDLRNPLATIMMTAGALRRARPDAGPDTALRHLRAIDRASARMNDLIRDLVDATRIEHGELALTVGAEAVGSIADQTLELHAQQAQEKGVTLEAAIGDRDAIVRCDRHRILQVLGNLMGNAIKATADEGRIVLRAHREASGVRFAVEDSGVGIKPEHLPHLYERYWTGQPDSGGVGLELYIASSIVEAHGAELRVESELGKGATFSFMLPSAGDPALAAATHPPAPLRGAGLGWLSSSRRALLRLRRARG